jgi:predicted alpha/beta-hydrolase family hydrolase
VLTHGAGANCQSNLLVAISNALADVGFKVLRCDLPFRQMRPHGPPFPASAERDRQGMRRAIAVLRARTAGRLFVGGHSYGGRQATMLVAEEPQLVEGMLLLSYPLHPPRKPSELRVGHFPRLVKPALFVHGTRDPFGSIGEMRSALERIPALNMLLEVEGMGHDLWSKNSAGDLPARIVTGFQTFFTQCSPRIDQT